MSRNNKSDDQLQLVVMAPGAERHRRSNSLHAMKPVGRDEQHIANVDTGLKETDV